MSCLCSIIIMAYHDDDLKVPSEASLLRLTEGNSRRGETSSQTKHSV